MSRFLLRAQVIGMLSLAWLPGASAAPKGKCTIAIKGDSPVAKACKEGGLKKADVVMKAMVKKGKEKGVKFDCDHCHKQVADNNFTLSKTAQEDFKKLL